jgi:VWFA-related protein
MWRWLLRGTGYSIPAMVFCLVWFFGSLPGYAQRGGGGRPNAGQSKTPAPYTIPVTVRRVVLDVVVKDKAGNPVKGLRRNDFAVSEQKKPQTIRSFEEFDFNTPGNFVAPKLPPLPPDTYVNAAMEQEKGPLNVIVYDAVHMEGANISSETTQGDQIQARKQLAAFLQSKPAGTRFALFVLAQDFRLLQGFTTDTNQLLATLDVHHPGGHIPLNLLNGQNLGKDDALMPFEVMAFLGHYLEGLPGRKNLIWMSSQFPAEVPLFGIQAAQVGNTMSAAAGSPLQGQGFDGSADTTFSDTFSQKIMKEAIDALNAAQVSVYPVDVGALNPALDGFDTIAEKIAISTGGHAYYNGNDVKSEMAEATADGSNYYEITYSPSDPREDHRPRMIEVKTGNKDYRLEYRRYYYAEDPDAPLTNDERTVAAAVADQVVAHRAGDSMYAFMEHGAPEAHDILFRAQFHAGPSAMATPDQMASLVDQPAYFVVRKSNKPVKLPPPIPLRPYTIDYLVLDQSAAAHTGGQVLEFAVCAYDSSGKMLNGLSQNAVRGDASAKAAQPIFRAEQRLEVPAAAAWLRVAVRDVNTDRIGTMEIPLPLAGDRQIAQGASANPTN